MNSAKYISRTNRLPCETTDIIRGNERYHVGVCLNPYTGEVCEVAANGPKVGSELYWMLQEVCVNLSHTFRDGTPPGDIAAGLTRGDDGGAMSIYGDIVDHCTTYEVADG